MTRHMIIVAGAADERLRRRQLPLSTPTYSYDPTVEAGEFGLDQVEIDIIHQASEKTMVRADVEWVKDGNAFDVQVEQAFMEYKRDCGTSIIFGQFNAPIGFELLDAPDMYQFSHALVFDFGLPTNLTGLALSRQLTEQFDIIAYGCNGWDANTEDNKNLTFGGRFGYSAPYGATMGLSAISGKEEMDDGAGGLESFTRTVFDVDLSYVKNAWTFGGEFNLGKVTLADDSEQEWTGFLVMGHYDFNDWLGFTGRYDNFDGPGPDRHRQDGGLRAAAAEPAAEQPSVRRALAGARPHPGTGHPDRRRDPAARAAHPHQGRRDLRRRGPEQAGERAAQPSRDRRRLPRPRPRPHRAGPAAPRERGDPGAGRGRPHVRHGLPARHPQDHARAAPAAAEPALLGHHAAEIRRLADDLLRNPHVVELAGTGPAATIDHALVPGREQRKRDLLEHVLRPDDCNSAIVFTRTKHRARRLAEQLSKAGHRAVGLQGNMSQGQRDRAMSGFRTRRFNILVATDIVARGIDVSGVSHVINFDVPNTPEAYTHRIGRTGPSPPPSPPPRSEREGVACTFVTGAQGSLRPDRDPARPSAPPRGPPPLSPPPPPPPCGSPGHPQAHRPLVLSSPATQPRRLVNRGRRRPPSHPAPTRRRPPAPGPPSSPPSLRPAPFSSPISSLAPATLGGDDLVDHVPRHAMAALPQRPVPALTRTPRPRPLPPGRPPPPPPPSPPPPPPPHCRPDRGTRLSEDHATRDNVP